MVRFIDWVLCVIFGSMFGWYSMEYASEGGTKNLVFTLVGLLWVLQLLVRLFIVFYLNGDNL